MIRAGLHRDWLSCCCCVRHGRPRAYAKVRMRFSSQKKRKKSYAIFCGGNWPITWRARDQNYATRHSDVHDKYRRTCYHFRTSGIRGIYCSSSRALHNNTIINTILTSRSKKSAGPEYMQFPLEHKKVQSNHNCLLI